MSWVTAAQGGSRTLSVPTNLDEITDEEFLRQLWQQAEDFGDRRRIRARMYRLREERLREMVQNDEENLGALTCQSAEEGDYEKIETESGTESERKTSIEVKMIMKGDSAITDSVTMQNVSRGGITMRGVGGGRKTTSSDEEIIEERIKEVSKGRGTRYQQIKSNYDQKGGDSVSKTSYSIQSNALAGDSYQSMKHKEVRDSVSPTRGAFDRSRMSGEDSETFFTSDDEVIIKSESAVISRKISGDDRSSPKIAQSKSETIVKKESPKKVTERKVSKDLTFSSNKRPEKSSPTSPTRRFTVDTKTTTKKQTASPVESQTSLSRNDPGKKSPSYTGTRTSNTKKSKLDQIAKQMDASLKNEYKRLDAYINENIDKNDEIIMEEEEEAVDEYGNIVKMIVQTRRNKDGTECTSRRVARSTKVVDSESEIDEILIGNPDHEVLARNVEEKEEEDGSKIKIITETRRRPDGIEYTTKNVLRTSKIFDYDHPEDISYCDHDELISSEESQETDEQGISIRTVTETRRKQDGTEYITKKVFKTSKVDVNITPSDDDEILDTQETEEKQSDGTITKTIIEKRRTRDGHKYTHRQIYRSRKVTLSSIDVEKGMPQMDNDDEIIDKKEKQELDENKSKVKVVTETRRRKDGTTYSFDYVLRSFKGTEKDIKNMPIKAGSSSNISVSANDKLLKEDIKEEIQTDGSTVKTITERRRAKDGTEYLRHRIMRIPKLREPELQVGSFDDEVLEEDQEEKVLDDGTHCRAITERRRSSVTGAQYTLRRMSKVYQHHAQVEEGDDEIIDENVTEEETSNGIVIKTVIRRYERPDGTFYTTHDIQKSYKNPVSVTIEGNDDDELVDRSYDERETVDGYIIKTIVETRTRADGTHYTVERTEKVSKLGDNVQVSFKGNSISVGSPGDKIISYEEHEEPSVNGIVIKTIVEIRQRADGTQYTNKTTIKSTQLLVPEHETSYVVIKADTRNGEEELDFFPSLDDEIVYTRKKNEVDEKGNTVTIVIETRKNNKSGELYNLTKRVHTTDVVMTTEGEKIFTNKRPVPKTPTNEEETDVPFGSVSALKSRFAPVNKNDMMKYGKVAIDRTNTANKKMFFEEAAAKTMTTKTSTPRPSTLERNKPKEPAPSSYDRKNRDKSDDSSPETPGTSRSTSPVKSKEPDESTVDKPLKNILPVKKITSPESSDTDSPKFKSIKPDKKPILTSPRKDKPSSVTDKSSTPSAPRTKKDISPKRERPQIAPSKSPETPKSKVRSHDSSPELKSSGSKSPTKQPVRGLRNRNESPIKSAPDSKSAQVTHSPISSSPQRGRSPLRSGTSTPRDGTPSGRPCCKHSGEPLDRTPKTKSSPVLRKKPSDDKIIVNGEKRTSTKPSKVSPTAADDLSKPKRVSQERSTKKPTNEITKKTASPRFERPSTISKTPEKRGSPSKIVDKRPEKPCEKEKKVEPKTPFLKVDSKDPIISMPQTPLTEEMKSYPSSTSPFIEDVSMEPDVPYQSVHRPSLVREPSEHPSTDKYSFEEYEREPKSKVDKDTKSYKLFEPKSKDKPKPEKLSDTSEEDSKKPTYSRYSSPTKRDYPAEDDNRKPYERTKKYEPSKISPEVSRKVPRDTTSNGYRKTDSEDEPTVDTKNRFTKLSERVSKIEDAAESLVSQIIPDKDEKKFATCKYAPESEPITRPASSIRQSLFEKSTKDPDSYASSPNKKEPLVPVVEPLVEKRHVHRLGTDDESDTESRPKVEKDVSKLTSTRLVMNAMSDAKSPDVEKDILFKKEEIDIVTPLRDRSMSPLSSYSRPRSKEGSPAPFMKEDSPGRFATGRPIDEGANISKIKRLERSHSNKKIIYEDLETESSNLPGYLVDIEYITDITVLEKLLQKAESYEERRVIRGHIRNLKKTDTNFRTPSSSPAPYKRFVDSTTPSKPSPTSSPLLTRRTPMTTTPSTTTMKTVPSYSQSKDVSETTRKSYTRASNINPELPPRRVLQRQNSLTDSNGFVLTPERDKTGSPMVGALGVLAKINLFERNNETVRKASFEETSTQKVSTEETWTTRKSSREETIRKSSREETSKVTSVESSRRVSQEDSTRTRKLSDEFKLTRKPSDDGPRLVRRVSKEDTKLARKSSTDEESKPKKKSSFEFSSKPRRRSSTDEDTKPKRKSSTDDDLKPKRKTANDDKLTPIRKTSTEVNHKPKRQSSTEDENIPKRKSSQNETLVSRRKTPEKDAPFKRMSSTEEDSKVGRKRLDETTYRKTSTEETNKYSRKISGEDKKYVKRQTSGESPTVRKISKEEADKNSRKISGEDRKYFKRQTSSESPVGRKISKEEPKSAGRPTAYDTEPNKSSVSDVKSSYSRNTTTSKKVESVVETSKYPRKTSAEKAPSHVKESSPAETGKRDLFPKEKSEPKTPSRFGRETPKDQPSTYTSRFGRGKTTTPVDDKKKQKPTPEESFVEPLRHQRNQNRAPVQQQTDMEKIVSPYGVGPTDENGLPLFGLRALKRRTQPTAPSEKAPEDFFKPKEEAEEFVPSDSQGKPLFGIKAVRKSPQEKTTYTATQVAKETATMSETHRTATAITEESHLTQSLISQPQTFETEVVTATNLGTEGYPSSDSTSDDSQDALRNLAERRQRRLKRKVGKRYNRTVHSDEEEENLKNLSKSKVGHLSSDEGHSSELDDGPLSDLPSQGETSPALVKAVHESLRRRHTSSSDSEVEEEEKSQNLKDIIKLHELKAADTVKPDSSPKLKPRKVIRDSFEPSNESPEPRTHKTWDLEADFSTRSDAIGNIIAKHETLTKQEKKLTGILKKTSTSSMTTSKLTSSEQDTDDDDALNKKNKSKYTEDEKKIERKTSYTEIKLSSPTRNVSGDVTKPIKKTRDKKPSPGPISDGHIVDHKDTYLDTQVTVKSTASTLTKTKTDEKVINVIAKKTSTGCENEITFTMKSNKPSSKPKDVAELPIEPSKNLKDEKPKFVTNKFFQINKKRQESPSRKKEDIDEKDKKQKLSPSLARKEIFSPERNRKITEDIKKVQREDIKTRHSSHIESCEFIKRKNLFDKIDTTSTTKRHPSPGRKYHSEYTDDEKPKQIDSPLTKKKPKSQPVTVPSTKNITPTSPKRFISPPRHDLTKHTTLSSPSAPTSDKKAKETDILKSTALIKKQDRIHKSLAEDEDATKKLSQPEVHKIKNVRSQFPDMTEAQTKEDIKRTDQFEISKIKQPNPQEPSHKITPKEKKPLRKTDTMKETSKKQSITQEINDNERRSRTTKKMDFENTKKSSKNEPNSEKQIPANSTVIVGPDELLIVKEICKPDKRDKKRKLVDDSLVYGRSSNSDDSEQENKTFYHSTKEDSDSSFKETSILTSDKIETIQKVTKKQHTDVVEERKPEIITGLNEPRKKVSDSKIPKATDKQPDSTTDENESTERNSKQTIKSSIKNEKKKEAIRSDVKVPEPDEKQSQYKTSKRKPGMPCEIPDSKSEEICPEDDRSGKKTSKREAKPVPDSIPKGALKLNYETKSEDKIENKTSTDGTKISPKIFKKHTIQPLKEIEQKLPHSKPLESSDISESEPDDKKTKKKSPEFIRKVPGESFGEQKQISSSDETENIRNVIKSEVRTPKFEVKKKHESIQQKTVGSEERTQSLSIEEINNLKNVMITEEGKLKKTEDKSVELETSQTFDSSLKSKSKTCKPEKTEKDNKKASEEDSVEQLDKVKTKLTDKEPEKVAGVTYKMADDLSRVKTKSKLVDKSVVKDELVQEITKESVINRRTVDEDSRRESEFQTSDKHVIVKKDLQSQFPNSYDSPTKEMPEYRNTQDDSVSFPYKKDYKIIKKFDKKSDISLKHEIKSTNQTELTSKKPEYKISELKKQENRFEETDEKDSVPTIHKKTKPDTDEKITEKLGVGDVAMKVGSTERLSVDSKLKLKSTTTTTEAEKVIKKRKPDGPGFKKVFTKEQVDSLLNIEPTLPKMDAQNDYIQKDSEVNSYGEPLATTKQIFSSKDNIKPKETSDNTETLSVKSESIDISSRKTDSKFTEPKIESSSTDELKLAHDLDKKTPKKAIDSSPRPKGKLPSSESVDTGTSVSQIRSLKKAEKDKLNSLEKQTGTDEVKKKGKTSTFEQTEFKVDSKVKTDLKKTEPARDKKPQREATKKGISKVVDEESSGPDSRKDSIKKTLKKDYHGTIDERIKNETQSNKKIYYQKEIKSDMSFKEFPRNKTPKNSPDSRFSSKSPEPEDITRRLKKLSRTQETTEENVTNMLQKKSTEARTSSLQSLSASSTTSSVPGYMRPRGDSRKHSTPERDPQEVEDLLLRSYEYTRCTKRVNKTPVSYDYAYSINTKEGPAGGGGGNYSIYFGPRKSVPATEQPKEVEFLRTPSKKVSVPDITTSVTEGVKVPSDYSEPRFDRDVSNKYDISHSQRTRPENEDDDLYIVEEFLRGNTIAREETKLKNVSDIDHENTSHFLGLQSVSEKEDRKESIKSIASIEQQYEDTLKALDTGNNLKPEDKSYLNIKKEYLDKVRSSSTMKASEIKETEDYYDSQQQYQDTVRNVSKDVLRKPSVQFREDIEYDDTNIASQGVNGKKSSVRDNLHPNIVIVTEKNDSSDKSLTSHYLTKSNLEKSSDCFKTTTQDYDHEGVENSKNLLSVDGSTQIGKSSDLQEKYNYQVEKNSSKYVKAHDSSYSSKQQVESASSKDYQSEFKTHDSTVNKYLPDYDYNKVYASKIIKSKKDSTNSFDQSSSQIEQFQTDDRQRCDTEYTSKFVAPETYPYRKHTQTYSPPDTQTFVTFDGRPVTRKPQQAHVYSSPTNKKSSTVGHVDHSMHLSSSHRDDESRPQVETSSCATVGQDKSTTFVRGSSRDETVNMSSQSNVITGESRSFLDDQSKVTGISDILSRMGASEAVDHEAKVTSDEQARSLLNKFIGAQVLMTGVESMMANTSQAKNQMSMMNNSGNVTVTRELSGQSATRALKDGKVTENRSTFSTGPQTISYGTSSASPKVEEVFIVKGVNINEVTDDFELNQLLDSCEEYEERRRVRLRLKALMAEKKALQKELGGHENSGFYSSSKRTAGVAGSKELRSSEGELESLIAQRLQSTYLAEGPISFNNSSSLGPQLSYASNFKVNEGGVGGENLSQRNRELNETKQFLRGIWEVTKQYKMGDTEEEGNSGEFSSDFIVEVSSVLDKLKSKISKSKSQSGLQNSNTSEKIQTEPIEEEDSGLVELIDKLQSSLGSVMLESKKQLHIDQNKQPDPDRNTLEDDDDADDEEESEDEIEGASQGESEDEEYETETVETVQTAILLKNEDQNNSVSKRSSGILLSSPSSPDSSTKGVTRENAIHINSNKKDKNKFNSSTPNSTSSPEIRQKMLNGKSSHSSSASSVSPSNGLLRQSSRDEARSYLSSAIVKCRSREELVRQQSGEDDEGNDEIDEDCKGEKTESDHDEISQDQIDEVSKDHETVKRKNLKDLPWKIRAAKKRMEQSCTKPAVPKPRFLYQTFNEAILNSKPRPYKPGKPNQSNSIGNLRSEMEAWKPVNYVGYFNRPINSKSSEAVYAPAASITHSLSADHVTKPKVPVNPESDDSEDSDEEEEGEVFSIKPLQKELPGIYHQQDKPQIMKPYNVLQKVDKKDVAKKSELFIKAAENAACNKYDQKPIKLTNKKKVPKASRPTLSKVKQVQGHTFQPNAAINNTSGNYNERIEMPPSPPTKRPTTLHLRYMVPDCRPSSDMFNIPSFESPTPPIPIRGEVAKAPPVPGRPGFLPVSRSQDRDVNLYQNGGRKKKSCNQTNYGLSRSRSTPTSVRDSFTAQSTAIQAESVKEKVTVVSVSSTSALKPVFTNEQVKTNMVSKLQSKFDGSMSEKTDKSLNHMTRKPATKSLINRNSNKTAEKFTLDNDPSKMLFTQEQLVKIAVHKAAINKQLSVGEQSRKSAVSRTYSLGSQDQQICNDKNYIRFNSIDNQSTSTSNYIDMEYSKVELKQQQLNNEIYDNGKNKQELNFDQQNEENQMFSDEVSEEEVYQEEFLGSENVQVATFHEPMVEQYQIDEFNGRQQFELLQKHEQQRLEEQNLELKNNENVKLEEEKLEQQWLKNQLIEQELEHNHFTEQQRMQQQRIEIEKVEHQILEQQRIEQMLELQKLEQQRLEQQRLEQEQLVQERFEQQKIEQQKIEQQRIEQQRMEHQRMEQQRIEQQRIEQQRIEQQRIEQQRIEQQRIEQQRIEQQKIEQQRIEQQKIEQQRIEQQRIEQQRIEQQRIEQQRIEQQRIEQQRIEQQRIEQQRIEQQRIEQQRIEQQRIEHQRIEQQRIEQQRIEQQKLEKLRIEHRRIEQQKIEQQKKEQQRIEQQKIERQRIEQQRIEQQRIEQQNLEKQKIELEKLEIQKAINDKQAKLEIEIKQQHIHEQQKINEQNRLLSQKISFQPRNTEHKKLQEKFEPRNLRELVQQDSAGNKSSSTEGQSRSPSKASLTHQSSVEGAIGFVSSAITRRQSKEDVMRRSLSISGRTNSHGSQSSVGDHEYHVGNNEDPDDEVFNENSSISFSSSPAGKIISPENQFAMKSYPPVASKNLANNFNSEGFSRFPQNTESAARVVKPVHRASSLLDKDRRRSAYVIGSQGMESKSFDKQEGFFSDTREAFRAKSSSVLTLSEQSPPIMPSSAPFNRAAQSLRNIKNDVEIQNAPISQVQTHLTQQHKWSSNPDSVNKAKVADFSVPPLPTTALLQHKMQQHRENIPALNSPPVVNSSFPPQKVSKWGSVPESISKPKASDFYVPPLPKTDFNKLVNKNLNASKALNNRAQSLTSLVSAGSASPPQQSPFRSGALEIITEKESEIQADKQGKVASMWESKVNDAHSKVIAIDKPWKKGTAAEITGQFVKRNKDKLLKNVDVVDQPVKVNLKKKFVAEITGQLVKVKGDKTNNKVKTNSANKVISKGNSAVGTVKQITNQLLKHVNKDNSLNNREIISVKPTTKVLVKQPKLKMFTNVLGTNSTVSPKVKPLSLTKEKIRNIEKLSNQESVSSVSNVIKNIEHNGLPNEGGSSGSVIFRNKKTKLKSNVYDSRSSLVNKVSREQMEIWHNQENIYSNKAGEFENRVIKSRPKSQTTKWENAVIIHEPEGPGFSNRIQKMNKEQVQAWLEATDKQMLPTKERARKLKGEVKLWNESDLNKEYSTSCIPWKDNPKSAAIVQSEKAKFEAELTTPLLEQPFAKEIRRSASNQIKSNIKVFEQQLVIEPFREPILHSGSMLVKKGVALFQEEANSEPIQTLFPIRSSKSAVFRKGAFESLLTAETETEISVQDKRRSWNEISSQRVSSILEKLETKESEMPVRTPILHSGSMLVKKGVALFQDDTDLEPRTTPIPLRSSKSAVFRKGAFDSFLDVVSPTNEMSNADKRRSFNEITSQKVSSILDQFEGRGCDTRIESQLSPFSSPKRPQTLDFRASTAETNSLSSSQLLPWGKEPPKRISPSPTTPKSYHRRSQYEPTISLDSVDKKRKEIESFFSPTRADISKIFDSKSKSKFTNDNDGDEESETWESLLIGSEYSDKLVDELFSETLLQGIDVNDDNSFLNDGRRRSLTEILYSTPSPSGDVKLRRSKTYKDSYRDFTNATVGDYLSASKVKQVRKFNVVNERIFNPAVGQFSNLVTSYDSDSEEESDSSSSSSCEEMFGDVGTLTKVTKTVRRNGNVGAKRNVISTKIMGRHNTKRRSWSKKNKPVLLNIAGSLIDLQESEPVDEPNEDQRDSGSDSEWADEVEDKYSFCSSISVPVSPMTNLSRLPTSFYIPPIKITDLDPGNVSIPAENICPAQHDLDSGNYRLTVKNVTEKNKKSVTYADSKHLDVIKRFFKEDDGT